MKRLLVPGLLLLSSCDRKPPAPPPPAEAPEALQPWTWHRLGTLVVIEGEVAQDTDLRLEGRSVRHDRFAELGPLRWELPEPPQGESAAILDGRGKVLARFQFKGESGSALAEPGREPRPVQMAKALPKAAPAPPPSQPPMKPQAIPQPQPKPRPAALPPAPTPKPAGVALPAPKPLPIPKPLPLPTPATTPKPAPTPVPPLPPLPAARILPKAPEPPPRPLAAPPKPLPEPPRVTSLAPMKREIAPPKTPAPMPPPPLPPEGVRREPGAPLPFPGAGEALNLTHGPRDAKRLLLSFDAGSNAEGTFEILEALRARRIRTTMFLTGAFIQKFPEAVRRMAEDGHELANHTLDHPHMAPNMRPDPKWTKARVQEELLSADRALVRLLGRPMAPLWRAPYGEHTAEIRRWAEELGYRHIGWSEGADTLDWATPHERKLYRNGDAVLARLHKRLERNGEGLIALMHLGSERNADDRPGGKLGPFLDRALAEGWTFVTASEMLRAMGKPAWDERGRMALLK